MLMNILSARDKLSRTAPLQLIGPAEAGIVTHFKNIVHASYCRLLLLLHAQLQQLPITAAAPRQPLAPQELLFGVCASAHHVSLPQQQPAQHCQPLHAVPNAAHGYTA